MGDVKQALKRQLLKKRGIVIDKTSFINANVKLDNDFENCKVIDSSLHITQMGDNCFFEHVYAYGNIELGKNISISGPGTVLHAEIGKIRIGSYTSIAPNVTITEFNHNVGAITTYGIKSNLFGHEFKEDVVSKGDIIIGEDVWIGSNVAILSGVRIGRGAIIAAGAVVNKNVEPYSIVGGVPAKKIKMRFAPEKIAKLEALQWWEWDKQKVLANRELFENEDKILDSSMRK